MVKKINILAALISSFSIISALYLQYHMEVEPCSLCLIQRYLLVLVSLCFIVASLGRGLLVIISNVFAILFLSLNLATIIRHLWLLKQPVERVSSCMAGFDMIFNKYSWWEAIKIIFKGSASCLENDFYIFGLSLPQLNLILTLVLIGLSITVLVKNNKRGLN